MFSLISDIRNKKDPATVNEINAPRLICFLSIIITTQCSATRQTRRTPSNKIYGSRSHLYNCKTNATIILIYLFINKEFNCIFTLNAPIMVNMQPPIYMENDMIDVI